MNKKTLIAALFTLVIILGAMAVFLIKPAILPRQEVPTEPPTPEGVTEAFYDWYITCRKKSFEEPDIVCSYQKSKYVTEKLVEKLEKIYATFTGGGADLIVCAQDIPTSFKVEQKEVLNGKTLVYVNEYFGEAPQDKIRVYLESIENKWRIVDIVCPIPSGLRYENKKYGFALTLPDTWEGYKVTVHEPEDVEKIKDVCFSFETGSLPICVLQINIFTKSQWEELKTRLAYLGEIDEFVFSYSYSPECVQHDEFQCARAKEVPEIIETFELLK